MINGGVKSKIICLHISLLTGYIKTKRIYTQMQYLFTLYQFGMNGCWMVSRKHRPHILACISVYTI